MEGFLHKKARGESSSIFSRNNWSKRWFILEGQFLTYYEKFDTTTGAPVTKKGVIPVKGCDLKLVSHQERQHVFVLRHPERRPVYLNAASESEKFVWLEALEKASKMKDGQGPGTKIDLTQYYELFGLDEKTKPEIKAIDRAYKKAALKAHPDKGGDSFKFKAVTDAYELIMSCLTEEENAKKYKTVEVACTIKKGPPGVGFGMVVVEDAKRGDIVVKDVLQGLTIVGQTLPPNGTVKKGDVLVGIDKDDIRGWPLTRVVARLNNFRVPVNGTVRLTFSRKVHIDGEEAERVDKPDFSEDVNPWEREEAKAADEMHGGSSSSGSPDEQVDDSHLDYIPPGPNDPYPNEGNPDE